MTTEDDLRRLAPDELLAVFEQQREQAANVVESARHALARASRMHRLAVGAGSDAQAEALTDERVQLAESLRQAEVLEREWRRRRDIVAAACDQVEKQRAGRPMLDDRPSS